MENNSRQFPFGQGGLVYEVTTVATIDTKHVPTHAWNRLWFPLTLTWDQAFGWSKA